jgi:molybdopterin converting factor small subunit
VPLVRVLAFARARELLAGRERSLDLPAGARVRDAWAALASQVPELETLAGSTRIARNGRIGSLDDVLRDGDELALLPPVGGG